MTRIVALLSALLWIGLCAGAFGVETGTPAWTIVGVTVHEGPGEEYDAVGDVSGDIQIRVERCQVLWCKVRAEGRRGWIKLGAISFGETSIGPFEARLRHNYNRGGPGTVCLYEGPNYSGAALCRSSGFVIRDLHLYHHDNVYSSISIEGNVSVTVCRDRFFRSYCELVSTSTPRLHGFLDNNVSSIRVY